MDNTFHGFRGSNGWGPCVDCGELLDHPLHAEVDETSPFQNGVPLDVPDYAPVSPLADMTETELAAEINRRITVRIGAKRSLKRWLAEEAVVVSQMMDELLASA